MNKQIRIVIFLAFLLFLFSSTNAQGILDAVVQKSPTTFEARNTDDIHCGYRTAKAGEQANFVCNGNPKLFVEVDNNYGLKLGNIVVAIDGELIGHTNQFGYISTTVSSGQHLAEIYYQLDQNSPVFLQQKTINIDSNLAEILFITNEEEDTQVGSLEDGNFVTGQCPICILVVLVAVEAIDFASIYWDLESLCDCLVNETKNPNFTQPVCMLNLVECPSPTPLNVQACANLLLVHKVNLFSCPTQYGFLAFDLSPATGAGIAKKAGATAFAIKIGDKAPIKEIWTGLGQIGEKITVEYISPTVRKLKAHSWEYEVYINELGQTVKRLWLKAEVKLSPEITQYIDEKVIKPASEAAAKTTIAILRSSPLTWMDEGKKGLLQTLEARGTGYYAEKLLPHGDEVAHYFSRGVGRVAINPNRIEAAKFVEIKDAHIALGFGDRFTQGETEQLEILIKNTTHGGTKIGQRQIEGVTRLTLGNDTFGWQKIWKKHVTGEIPGGDTFPGVYGISDPTEIKKLIDESVQNPYRIDDESNGRFVYWYSPFPGKPPMKTIIDNSDEFFKGRTVSSYPCDRECS